MRKIIVIAGTIISIASQAMNPLAQEQKVLWRQIKIGSYTVTWPASQGGASSCLTNDGSGNLSWGTCSNAWQAVGGIISQITATDHVQIGGGATVSELRFQEASGNGSNYVGLKAPTTISADKIWVLPSGDGTTGQALVTDGTGTLSWATPTASHPDPHRLGDGSTSAPTYSFSGATGIGMYRSSGTTLGLGFGTSGKILMSTGGFYSSLALYNPGTEASTGNYLYSYTSAGELHILRIQASKIMAPNGSWATPAYSFDSYGSNGMYATSSAQVAIKAAGVAIGVTDNHGESTFGIYGENGHRSVISALNTAGDTAAVLYLNSTNVLFPSTTQTNLGSPTNGTQVYCSNCDSSCAAGGTGAMAMRINGAWKCIQ